jgi:hypothetical protein
VQMALNQVSDIQMGLTARERLEPMETGTPVIHLRDLQPDGRFNPGGLIKCQLGAVAPRYLVTNGDILFRSRGDKNTATMVAGLGSASVAVLPLVIIRPKTAVVQPDVGTQERIVEIERLAAEERRLSLQLMDMRRRVLTSKLRGLARASRPTNKVVLLS